MARNAVQTRKGKQNSGDNKLQNGGGINKKSPAKNGSPKQGKNGSPKNNKNQKPNLGKGNNKPSQPAGKNNQPKKGIAKKGKKVLESEDELDSDVEMQEIEVKSGKKSKIPVISKPINLKKEPVFAKAKGKAVNKKVEVSDDESEDESLDDEDLEDEELDLEGEELEFEDLDEDEEEEVVKPKAKKGEEKKVEKPTKEDNKKKTEEKKTSKNKDEKRAQKRLAEVEKSSSVKKARLEDSVIAEEERRRKERDSRTLVLKFTSKKQKKASDSNIKALHPNIINVVRMKSVAFLHFATEKDTEVARTALEKCRLLNGPIIIDYSGKKSTHESKPVDRTVMADLLNLSVSGLTSEVTKDKLEIIFPKAKEIYHLYSKKLAFMHFDNEDDGREAFEKGKGLKICGVPVIVQYKKLD